MRDNTARGESGGFTAEWNSKFVSLVEQMVVLKEAADEIFSRLRRDAEQVADRSERLSHRLKSLETAVESMPNPRTLKLDSAGSLSRYTSVECHFVSERPLDSSENFFCPSRRPPGLQKLFAAAGREGEGAPAATENISTQTEDDPLFSRETTDSPQSSFGNPPRKAVQHQEKKPNRRTSVAFDKASALPTPEQQSSTIATIYKSTVISVDISGSNLQRISAARQGKLLHDNSPQPLHDNLEFCNLRSMEPKKVTKTAHSRRPRTSRRNTVAITSTNYSNLLENCEQAPVQEPERGLSPIEDNFYPDEPTYDVLPFQKRRSRFIPSNPFSSLRRSPKKPRDSVIYASLKRHPVSAETSERVANSDDSRSSENIYGEFKRLIRRSVSLRLGQRKKKAVAAGESDYEDVPVTVPRKVVAPVEYSRNSLKKKLSLPISTTSQVLHLATILREQPENGKCKSKEFRERPLSIISASSNVSLELMERNSCTGWYRQGYQIDFPEECLPIDEEGSPEDPRAQRDNQSDSSSSGHSSPKDPIPDSSSDPDSNYSCDQEGYYTSMHRDSGLPHPPPSASLPAKKTPGDFRGRSFSTHSSSSTVAEPKDRPSSGDSGAADLQSPVGSHNPEFLSSMVRVVAKKAFPPLCEVSLSGESEINSPQQFRRSPLRATMPTLRSPPALPPRKPQADKFFDDWLLQKFQNELSLKGNETYCQLPAPRELNYAVPVRKAVRFCE